MSKGKGDSMKNNNNIKAHSRYKIIKPIIEKKKTVNDIIQESSISRATVYRWLKRYREEGYEGLSHKSHDAYNKTSYVIRDLIYSLRKERLFRSSGDIANEINKKYGHLLFVVEHKKEITRQTVWRILKEKGLNSYCLKRAER